MDQGQRPPQGRRISPSSPSTPPTTAESASPLEPHSPRRGSPSRDPFRQSPQPQNYPLLLENLIRSHYEHPVQSRETPSSIPPLRAARNPFQPSAALLSHQPSPSTSRNPFHPLATSPPILLQSPTRHQVQFQPRSQSTSQPGSTPSSNPQKDSVSRIRSWWQSGWKFFVVQLLIFGLGVGIAFAGLQKNSIAGTVLGVVLALVTFLWVFKNYFRFSLMFHLLYRSVIIPQFLKLRAKPQMSPVTESPTVPVHPDLPFQVDVSTLELRPPHTPRVLFVRRVREEYESDSELEYEKDYEDDEEW
ncbi:hypothetical protein GYMLUDRAFT_1027688 [Collybiopsis luxurians FD-317 M1]|nr:hypothetical protein GYMLUDRAFT_1027688 [Collybiopsis luxurians FD-317 M1]